MNHWQIFKKEAEQKDVTNQEDKTMAVKVT